MKIINLVLIIFLYHNCDKIGVIDDVPKGAYSYSSFDTSGTFIVTGWFKFEMLDSVSLKGEWDFRKVGNPQNIGPQTGSGKLVGGKSDTTIWIELNPHVIDNNLQLSGKIEGERIHGQWQWSSFAGVSNWGEFEAVKK